MTYSSSKLIVVWEISGHTAIILSNEMITLEEIALNFGINFHNQYFKNQAKVSKKMILRLLLFNNYRALASSVVEV